MVLMRSLVEFVIIFVITETPNTINSRTLVLASFGGGKLTVKCPSPETLRRFGLRLNGFVTLVLSGRDFVEGTDGGNGVVEHRPSSLDLREMTN